MSAQKDPPTKTGKKKRRTIKAVGAGLFLLMASAAAHWWLGQRDDVPDVGTQTVDASSFLKEFPDIRTEQELCATFRVTQNLSAINRFNGRHISNFVANEIDASDFRLLPTSARTLLLRHFNYVSFVQSPINTGRALNRIYTSHSVDDEYLLLFSQNMASIRQEFLDNPIIATYRENWNELPLEDKMRAARYVADLVTDRFDVKPVNNIIDRSETLWGAQTDNLSRIHRGFSAGYSSQETCVESPILGYYNTLTAGIVLHSSNCYFSEREGGAFNGFMILVLHETLHHVSLQLALEDRRNLSEGGIAEPITAYHQYILANLNVYVPPYISEEIYRKQPFELVANMYEDIHQSDALVSDRYISRLRRNISNSERQRESLRRDARVECENINYHLRYEQRQSQIHRGVYSPTNSTSRYQHVLP